MFYVKSSSHMPSLASSLLSPCQADVSLVCPSLSLPAQKALLLHHLPSLLPLLCPSCSPHDPLVLLFPDTPAPDLRSAIHQLYVRADPTPLASLLEIREKSETKFKVEKERVNMEKFPGELKNDDKEEEKYNTVQGSSDYNKS